MTGQVRAQVLVVGGGPVGLLTAAELAGQGVRTVVLEAAGAVSEQPKATTLHARVVQSLVRRGYLEPPAADGAVSRSFHFAGIPGLSVAAPAEEPAPILKRPQADLERLFEARARASGARIMRGYRAVEVRTGPDGAQVTAEGPHGPVRIGADYLVGADGAHSLVRERAGIGSSTAPATVAALAGEVTLADPAALAPGWHRTPRGWIVCTALPGGRTYLRVLDCTGAAPDRRPPAPEELRRQTARIAGRDVPMTDIRWPSRFSDFSRLADTFRSGRVLLAGDSAHVHFPIGGQGLGTGLLDAVNLGWKLALTVRGLAGPRLLDSYDPERRPAARRVIDNTRAQLVLMNPDPFLDPLRGLLGDLVEAAGPAGGYLGGLISAQDTVLPARTDGASAWEGRFLPNTRLATTDGETDVVRLLGPGRPVLLLAGERGGRYLAEAGPWAGLLSVVRTARADALPEPALLVRPDGYLAWAAGGGGLGQALEAHFGGRPQASAARRGGVRAGARGAGPGGPLPPPHGYRRSARGRDGRQLGEHPRTPVGGDVQGGQDGGQHHAGQQVPQQAGDPLGQVLVVGQHLGHLLDSGEGAHRHRGGLLGHDVRQQLALGLGPFEHVPDRRLPAAERRGAVEPGGLHVQ